MGCDLMEGLVWPRLVEDFRERRGWGTGEEVIEGLNPDCRWVYPNDVRPELGAAVASREVAHGPLAGATTVAEVEAWPEFDPASWEPPDFAAARRRWPDQALVLLSGWVPLFWGACEAFGMEEAMVLLYTAPQVFEAFVQRRHERYMEWLRRAAAAGEGVCDVFWLGDDYAYQQAMILSPTMWRRFIKPYLAEQVQFLRDRGLLVLLHSCGAIREILPDLIEIGVNGHLVFQTNAAKMSAASIARDFGGRMVFYGGIDVQHVLSFGTEEEVRAAVAGSCRAFAECGGYIVANSHHGLETIKGRSIEMMFEAARGRRAG